MGKPRYPHTNYLVGPSAPGYPKSRTFYVPASDYGEGANKKSFVVTGVTYEPFRSNSLLVPSTKDHECQVAHREVYCWKTSDSSIAIKFRPFADPNNWDFVYILDEYPMNPDVKVDHRTYTHIYNMSDYPTDPDFTTPVIDTVSTSYPENSVIFFNPIVGNMWSTHTTDAFLQNIEISRLKALTRVKANGTFDFTFTMEYYSDNPSYDVQFDFRYQVIYV